MSPRKPRSLNPFPSTPPPQQPGLRAPDVRAAGRRLLVPAGLVRGAVGGARARHLRRRRRQRRRHGRHGGVAAEPSGAVGRTKLFNSSIKMGVSETTEFTEQSRYIHRQLSCSLKALN